MISFPQMSDILQPCSTENGSVSVEHYTVSEQDSAFTRIRAIQHPEAYVAPGKYTRLMVDGELMMSDTDMEKRTNREVVRQARGDVLIAGLGLGMILHPILAKPEVDSVTVVEIDEGVIKLVSPSLSMFTRSGRLKIEWANIFTWKPSGMFDAIYFDIWPDISLDNLDQMTKLHRRFARRLRAGGWMNSWTRDALRSVWRSRARSGR